MHWIARLFRKTQAEKQLDSELRFHLEQQAADHVARGVSPGEARRRAALEFGGLEAIKEESRVARRGSFFETLFQDVRYGLRMLRKNPGFTITAVITLALGIGVNTAIFSIVDAVIFRPLPYKDSSRIVNVYLKTSMFPDFNLGITWPAFDQIRSQASAIESSAVYSNAEKTLTGKSEPAILSVANVSDGFFAELGTTPELGRLFTEQDQPPGQSHVVVLSYALWRTRFGADRSILGQTLTLDKEPYTVVGVASRGFSFPPDNEAWLPLSLTTEDQQSQTLFILQFIGKLRPGQQIAQLKPQLDSIAQRIVKDNPQIGATIKFATQPLLEGRIANSRNAYFVLLGAAMLVLLIACANFASLLLARGSGRAREMAVRAALGASPARLLRQGLVESCLLALLGGAVGTVLAMSVIQLFRAIAPHDTPRLAEISIDSTLLWFSLLSSLVAGIVFGLVPARRAARMRPNEALKEGSGAGMGTARTTRQSKLGNALVIVEVALAFILLVSSALMTQTVSRLLHQNPGFRTDHLLTFDVPQSPITDPTAIKTRQHEQTQQLQRILETLQGVPGVSAVTAVSHGVLGHTTMMMGGFQVEGAVPATFAAERQANARIVYPSYFRTLGIPLVRGREFSDHPAEKAPPEVVVNEALARAYWGTVDVLRKRISISKDDQGKPVWSEVVGVVADAREVAIAVQATPVYYLSLLTDSSGSYNILLRTSADPEALAGAISHQLWSLYPDQPISHVTTMTQIISKSVGDQRLRSVLLVVFAGIGFSLALVGAYGVISFSVARRIQEIGVRMALGARPWDVLRMVLSQGLWLVGIGIAIGAAASFGLTRFIASQLYGVKPTDSATFLGATVMVLVVACAACYIPARRAMRVDPIIALRYE
jgi:predicted permease